MAKAPAAVAVGDSIVMTGRVTRAEGDSVTVAMDGVGYPITLKSMYVEVTEKALRPAVPKGRRQKPLFDKPD